MSFDYIVVQFFLRRLPQDTAGDAEASQLHSTLRGWQKWRSCECLHLEQLLPRVMGDRYQLCARDLDSQLPHTTERLEFEACQNGVAGIADIPKNSERCAKRARVDWSVLQTCAEGKRGLQLYHDSVFFTFAHCSQSPSVCYDFAKSVVNPSGSRHSCHQNRRSGERQQRYWQSKRTQI